MFDENGISEADYMNATYPNAEDLLYANTEANRYIQQERIHAMNVKYQFAENVDIGCMLICPVCGKAFKKKTGNQKFCCTKCKDRYWNMVRDN